MGTGVSPWSAIESLRGAPLRVVPTAEHQRAQRDVARELGLTCGDEHRRFWDDLRAHHERIRTSPDDTPREIVRVSAEALRVRDAMCARRAVLGAPPATPARGRGPGTPSRSSAPPRRGCS